MMLLATSWIFFPERLENDLSLHPLVQIKILPTPAEKCEHQYVSGKQRRMLIMTVWSIQAASYLNHEDLGRDQLLLTCSRIFKFPKVSLYRSQASVMEKDIVVEFLHLILFLLSFYFKACVMPSAYLVLFLS